ncbi:MAG TPA: arylsulfatase, partial [Candidatus Hydrogenedentes bacterium]|nr:arylsulfatase [Candidatus Hydrogenedentota bacterium]
MMAPAYCRNIAAAATPPNIVIIMADDMGYSDIGCYGGEIQTPNLDRLAAGGVRFTQFYNAARCCPTRAALLTGLYPHQAGVGGMVGPGGREPGYRGRLNESCVTIAETLHAAGYTTLMSGKYHVTHYNYTDPEPTLHRASWPLQRGFDRFFGTLAGAGSYYAPVSLMRGNEFIEASDDFYYTDAISDTAAQFIREADADNPLFLYTAHVAPHWPLHALPEDIEKYKGIYRAGWDEIRAQRHGRMINMGLVRAEWPLTERDERVPAWDAAEHKEWEIHRMAVYAAQIDRMDQGVGRIIKALEDTNRLDNTLILFLADNGGCDEIIKGQDTRHGYFERGGTTPDVFPGEPDTYAAYGYGWANASNTPFRKYKKWIHEGGIASPLIAHWPAGIAGRGALRHQVAHVTDLMATCVDIADAAYPETRNGHDILPMEGVSLAPAFADKPLERTAPLFWEHIGNRGMRDGN